MSKQGLPRVLRWIYFSLSIGTLMASGIYLGAGLSAQGISEPLRALMFFLLGTFFMLMYGENRPDSKEQGSSENAELSKTEHQ